MSFFFSVVCELTEPKQFVIVRRQVLLAETDHLIRFCDIITSVSWARWFIFKVFANRSWTQKMTFLRKSCVNQLILFAIFLLRNGGERVKISLERRIQKLFKTFIHNSLCISQNHSVMKNDFGLFSNNQETSNIENVSFPVLRKGLIHNERKMWALNTSWSVRTVKDGNFARKTKFLIATSARYFEWRQELRLTSFVNANCAQLFLTFLKAFERNKLNSFQDSKKSQITLIMSDEDLSDPSGNCSPLSHHWKLKNLMSFFEKSS